jgi:hypothetical protein
MSKKKGIIIGIVIAAVAIPLGENRRDSKNK